MEESKFKKILGSRSLLFILVLAAIWLTLISVKTLYRKYQLDNEISSLKKEIAKIDRKDQELTQLMSFFNNQDFLEKEAKEKLNLKREGENVVMVPEAAFSQESITTPTSVLGQSETAAVSENNFVEWWKYFFGQ
jgi:cell division protein FtsB